MAQDKVSYVEMFAPWQLVFIAGAWIDDVDAAFRTALLRLGLIGGAILLVTLLVAWRVNRDITGSFGGLKTAMDRLANGDLSTSIPGTERRDEVGDMAAALLVFKDHMVEAERLRAAQEQDGRLAATEQKAALHRMADGFESQVGGLVELLAASSTQLEATSQSMAGTATQSNQRATAVAAAAGQASAGLETVAAAAEELTASIGEIGRQVAQSAKITGKAVEEARRTDAMVQRTGRGGREDRRGRRPDHTTSPARPTCWR